MADYDRPIHWLGNQVSLLALFFLLANNDFPSIKLVGLFVTALVGLYTIEDLWDKFGDLKMSVVCFPT